MTRATDTDVVSKERAMSERSPITPADAYTIVAEFSAKPGMEEELRSATLPLVAQARSEPNVLSFLLHEDRDRPGHFIFYEVYTSESDFEAHRAKPHVRAWFARLPGLTANGVRAVHMAILGAGATSSGGGEA
jgi:quinol monooxygenase YgiN